MISIARRSLVLLAFAFAAPLAQADADLQAFVEQTLAKARDQHKLPGVAALVQVAVARLGGPSPPLPGIVPSDGGAFAVSEARGDGAVQLLDAAALWVFIKAFGETLSPVNLIVAYGLAGVLAATRGGLDVVAGVGRAGALGAGLGAAGSGCGGAGVSAS